MVKRTRLNKMKYIAIVAHTSGDSRCEMLKGFARYMQVHPKIAIRQVLPPRHNEVLKLNEFSGIITDGLNKPHIEMLKAPGLPIVDLSGEMIDDPEIITIDNDLEKTGTMVAERFLQRGFKNFAYFGIDGKRACDTMSNAFCARVEKEGYACSILKMNNFFIPMYITKPCKHGNGRILKWLKNLPHHTAVFCLNDAMAQAVLSWCIEIGRAVPQDIAIIGTNNDISRCMCSPVPISSVDMNWSELGYAAMRLVAHAIDHPLEPKVRHPFLIPPGPIVERESTAVYPVDPPWLSEALSLIDTNMNRPISAADLAANAGVSHTTLQTAFRKALGTSPGKYILSVKMREAKRLLGEGNFSVKEVASMTGFASRSYFSHTYSGYFGHAPVKYRTDPRRAT